MKAGEMRRKRKRVGGHRVSGGGGGEGEGGGGLIFRVSHP